MKITNREVQDFIRVNENADCHALLLKPSPFEGVGMHSIVEQIVGRKVSEKKFPFLLKQNIIFPPKINLEQASSQVTAEYKSDFFSGKKFLDITSGFGVDAYFLSKNFTEATLVEQNQELMEIVRHNWEVLGRKAEFVNCELEVFLKKNQQKYDLIYIDPARRGVHQKRVFLLEDLSPDITVIQHKLFEISDKILIKLSPLIDIKYLLSVLKNISKIKIIAVRNDVKEILVLLDIHHDGDVMVSAVNLETNDPEFVFEISENRRNIALYDEVKNYLYIPNNAVLKTGAFELLSQKLNLSKLHPNTHFYTLDERLESFPGRVLRVEEIKARSIRKGEAFNIVAKNYPLKPDEIKKKYKIKDGGMRYLIFTQTRKGKIILKSD